MSNLLYNGPKSPHFSLNPHHFFFFHSCFFWRCIDRNENDISRDDCSSYVRREFNVFGFLGGSGEVLAQLRLIKGKISSIPPLNEQRINVTHFEFDLWIATGHGNSCQRAYVAGSYTRHNQSRHFCCCVLVSWSVYFL